MKGLRYTSNPLNNLTSFFLIVYLMQLCVL